MHIMTCHKFMITGENSARSKICVRLSDRFDEPQNIDLEQDGNPECSSNKKQKLN